MSLVIAFQSSYSLDWTIEQTLRQTAFTLLRVCPKIHLSLQSSKKQKSQKSYRKLLVRTLFLHTRQNRLPCPSQYFKPFRELILASRWSAWVLVATQPCLDGHSWTALGKYPHRANSVFSGLSNSSLKRITRVCDLTSGALQEVFALKE